MRVPHRGRPAGAKPRRSRSFAAASPSQETNAEATAEDFELADHGAQDLDEPGRFGSAQAAAKIAAVVDDTWRPRLQRAADIDALVERLPDQPGVYVMRDRKGAIVYVGKARRLRVRVRQYFNGTDERRFVGLLAGLLGDIETVVTTNDKEALLLENNLIKRHKPRFNVKLRDDKQFLVLRLDPRGAWPRLELVRRMRQDGAQYFGPYHSASSARHTLRVVNRHFKLRTCTDYTLTHRTRPCLQHQIGRCPAPCVYPVDRDTYQRQVKSVGLFLNGRHKELLGTLQSAMETAAEALEFEVAARLRDQISALETSLERQQVVDQATVDQDVVGMYREGGQVEFVVMHVRQGKLLGTRSFSVRGMELPDAEVLSSFLLAFYDDAPAIPDEVIVPYTLDDDDLVPLGEWLHEHSGHKVAILVPARGDRKKLLVLAQKNAASNFASRRNRHEDTTQALQALQQRLGLGRLPRTIECYDISHIQGTDPVASMVVFVDGAPARKRYRSFKIRGLDGLAQGDRQNDDFASMAETLARRLRRGLEVDPTDHDNPWTLPDLIVIDGGKGQLGRVVALMRDLGLQVGPGGLDVVSLAKERTVELGRTRATLEQLRRVNPDAPADSPADTSTAALAPPVDAVAHSEAAVAAAGLDPQTRPGKNYQDYVLRAQAQARANTEVRPERVFVPGARDALRLRPGTSELYLMTQIRDEAHRFAISHHRARRGKRALHSILDDIPGIGPSLKQLLLRSFGSVAAIAAADDAALTAIKGVGPAVVRRLREALQNDDHDK